MCTGPLMIPKQSAREVLGRVVGGHLEAIAAVAIEGEEAIDRVGLHLVGFDVEREQVEALPVRDERVGVELDGLRGSPVGRAYVAVAGFW